MSDMDLPLAVRMMQDGYLMEIDALQTENAELRKERDALDHLTDVLNDSNDGLLYENAKLRELVAYMHRCYVRGHDRGFYGAPEKEHVEAIMRELGVKV